MYTFLINAAKFQNIMKVIAGYFKPPTVTALLRSVTHRAHGERLRLKRWWLQGWGHVSVICAHCRRISRTLMKPRHSPTVPICRNVKWLIACNSSPINKHPKTTTKAKNNRASEFPKRHHLPWSSSTAGGDFNTGSWTLGNTEVSRIDSSSSHTPPPPHPCFPAN